MPLRHLSFLLAAVLAAGPLHAFDLQGHRGARGLLPENTLPAFERALEIGVSTLELDVGLSADGVVVVSHDAALNPAITRDGGGAWLAGARGPLIRSLRFEQLQTFDVGRIDAESPYARSFGTQQPVDGARIPSLAQLFDRVEALGAHHVRFNIETKINPTRPEDTVGPEAMARALLAAVRAAGMDARTSIQSFDWRTLKWVRRLDPAIPVVHLTIQTLNNDNTRGGAWTAGLRLGDHGGSVPRLVKAAGGTTWSPNAGALTDSLVKEAQALGLKVIPWTVNQAADMERLIGWGVDGLITDYPDRLREVMRARGLPLPPPIAR